MNSNKIEQIGNKIVHCVESEKFSQYGRILDYDITEVISLYQGEYLEKSQYIVDVDGLKEKTIFQKVQKEIYGQLNIQAGIVYGRNDALTGIEYHMGSEVNIALTDCILVLGNSGDMKDGTIDISELECFYVKKGQILEIYSGVLHYTPIEVEETGMAMIVVLLEGTNTDIPYKKGDLLIKKNKWYVCHESQDQKIALGYKVGLLGEMMKIQK